jgi:hypothetical protein
MVVSWTGIISVVRRTDIESMKDGPNISLGKLDVRGRSMLSRRSFGLGIAGSIAFLGTPAFSNPILWIIRGLMAAGGRGAAARTLGQVGSRSLARGFSASGARSVSTNIGTLNLSVASGNAARAVVNVVPYAARNAEARTRAIDILNFVATSASAIAAVAPSPVYAQMTQSPEDSLVRVTVAYYALLSQNDRDAQLAMWVDPDEVNHFRNVGRIEGYELSRVDEVYNDGLTATTYVEVYGKNSGEPWNFYALNIHWIRTEYGWLILHQQSV